MDISNWVAHRASWERDRVAVCGDGTTWTYAQFEDRVARCAGVLRALGIVSGDRVVHLGLNSPDLLALYFACCRIGAIIVPLNWRLTAAEHAHQLGDAGPTALFAEPEYFAHVAGLRSQFPALRCVAYRGTAPGPGWSDYEVGLAGATPLPVDRTRTLDTPCEINYTSGTTGRPKGSLRTQKAVFYNALNSIHVFEMTPQDHVLTALPMFHAGGMHIQTTPAIYAGATVTIHRRFNPSAVLREIQTSRPTLLLTVPAVSLVLIDDPEFANTDMSCLKCVCCGSSVVPPAAFRPWLARNVAFNQVYGMTETGPISIASSLRAGSRKPASAGKPVLHLEARIVDDAGGDVNPGSQGEIWLRGPSIAREYWRNPQATHDSYTGDGWFKTGDVAHCDQDGFYYVDDRKKDVIISGGENIYPAELESVLADCEALSEWAVIGRPHPRWGEVPIACVIAKPRCEVTEADIKALFEGRLARFKHPAEVMFLSDPLPRTSLGKVQKFELRRRLKL
jgi:fatty-acyl-CoA synthase